MLRKVPAFYNRSVFDQRITAHALRRVSLQTRESELLPIEGPSDSGKSTMMNVLGQPASGEYDLNGSSTLYDLSRT